MESKGKKFLPSCYSELPRLAINCIKEGIKKKIILSLIGFCGRGGEKGGKKEINKKMNSIWLMGKIRVSM